MENGFNLKHPIITYNSKNYHYRMPVKAIGNLARLIDQMKKEILESEDDYILSILEAEANK